MDDKTGEDSGKQFNFDSPKAAPLVLTVGAILWRVLA